MTHETVQEEARELLKHKRVEVVIGYRRSPDGISAAPAFIYRQEDADTLIWDASCVYNLAVYLKDFPGKKAGIVARECDVKSITVLLQERQLRREDVVIIPVGPAVPEEDPYAPVRAMEAKPREERLKTWQEEFSRCIRCYACRQVCPLCYCPRCVADQIRPQWFSRATNQDGNFAWNAIRAMHLAGRCTDCGACDRACPMGIPLRLINKKIEKDIKEMFKFEAGASVDQKPLLAGFDANDPGDFIQ